MIRLPRPLLTAFLVVAAAAQAQAQRLTVSAIDSSAFPEIRARVYILDANGRPFTGLGTGDVVVAENGVRRTVTALSCTPAPPPRAISSVLVIDVSGSMASSGTSGGTPNIELARTAADAWVQGLPEGESECAIASFDDRSMIISDFTSDRAKLVSAIAALAPKGGTNYNAALMIPPAGGIPIVAEGKQKHIVVFLTDGRGGGNEAAIIDSANRANAAIFCVTLGMPAPDELKRIARRTGGEYYENVTTIAEARAIYQAILFRALGGEPCELVWQSEPSCAPERNATIALPAQGLATAVAYTAPKASVPAIDLDPPALRFGVVAPGTSKEMRITLTARNRAITVQGIDPVGRAGAFALSGTSTPFTLAAGERRTLTVRYTAADTNYAFARWAVRGDACSGNSIAASAGSGAAAAPTIHLLAPNGGERFNAGEQTSITWEGVLPSDTVRLDYSTNDGASWHAITDRATGGAFRWRVPATPSQRCRARVALVDHSVEKKKDDAIGLAAHDDYVMSTNFSGDGSRAITASWDGTARVWDARSGTLLQTLRVSTGANGGRPKRVYYAEMSPDSRRILTAADGNDIGIWDAASGRLARRLSGKLFQKPDVEGARMDGDVTPDPVFSPDGRHVIARADRDPVVFDVSSGTAVKLLGHTDWVNAATFSPDGRWVLTGSRDSTARIWDAATGRELRRFNEHHEGVTSVAFSNDGRVATAGYDNVVRVWSAASGEQLAAFPVKERHGGTDLRAIFSPDASSLLVWAGVDIAPRLYDLATGKEIMRLEEHENDARSSVGYALFSPDGSQIAVREASVDVWDIDSHRKTHSFPWDMQMSYLAFSPDGSRIAASDSKTSRLWRVDPATLQDDRSDSLWAIIDSHPASVDVDFGRRAVRTQNDSVVSGFIRNSGTAPLRVDRITISGANAKEFSLVSGIPPFDVPPGSAHNVEFRFTPASTGARTATAEVEAGGRTLRQSLRGEGARSELRMDASSIDFGDVEVGSNRDTVVTAVLRNSGNSPVEIAGVAITGPDTSQFAIMSGGSAFTLAPNGSHAMTFRFSPKHAGRTSTRITFRHSGVGGDAETDLYGRGGEAEPTVTYTDPTTFRTIAVPNAVVPKKGAFVLGVYDVAGVTAGWVPVPRVMIIAGGGIPFPDDWGGVHGTMYGAYSLGLKVGILEHEKLDIAAGYQFARSIYDREETRDSLESSIVVHAPYVAASYGDDDSRISVTAGYAFKQHTTIDAGTFTKNAAIVSVGGDYRFANRWKVAAEVLGMQTLGFVPVAATARYFGETWAVDAGLGYLGITTGDGDAPSLKVAPVISFVKRW
ncbi:MAG: choice-of-anchor D domain-containing protein [Bacteroidetes bacterium]|nr:choice-of-anchor D domain-containing protein [Bacteroidota bacterium]